MKIEVDGWRAHITFSSAHFIPEYAKCGRLHGHTYAIHAVVEGETDERGIVMDFSVLKERLRTIADELDHRVLIPDQGNVKIHESEGSIEVCFQDKRYLFPADDCRQLPIASSSAEHLAAYILRRVMEEMLVPANVAVLHIGVDEGYGQGAWTSVKGGKQP